MGAGLARELFGSSGVEVRSGGVKPAAAVHPAAVKAMAEIGIDISAHTPAEAKSLDPAFLKEVNFVFTLCTEDICPPVSEKAKHLTWSLPDPALAPDPVLVEFRKVRDRLKLLLAEWGIARGLIDS